MTLVPLRECTRLTWITAEASNWGETFNVHCMRRNIRGRSTVRPNQWTRTPLYALYPIYHTASQFCKPRTPATSFAREADTQEYSLTDGLSAPASSHANPLQAADDSSMYSGTMGYIAMDYIDGANVGDLWQHLTSDQKRDIVNQTADAISQLQAIELPSAGPLGGGLCPPSPCPTSTYLLFINTKQRNLHTPSPKTTLYNTTQPPPSPHSV